MYSIDYMKRKLGKTVKYKIKLIKQFFSSIIVSQKVETENIA